MQDVGSIRQSAQNAGIDRNTSGKECASVWLSHAIHYFFIPLKLHLTSLEDIPTTSHQVSIKKLPSDPNISVA